MIRKYSRAKTVLATATNGLLCLQLMAGFTLLGFSVLLSAQETAEDQLELEYVDEVVDLAEDDDTPKFVVPPDPTLPYLDAIDRFEEDFGPYATELSDLYLGLGEVYMKDGEYEQARDAYHRGVLVVRVNAGPNSPEQTNLLYLIANIETLLDEPKQADKIIDNVRFINEQYYGEHSPELYPVFERMYDWYHTARPLDVDESKYKDYLEVIDVAEAMVDIQEHTNGLTASQAARAYRRMAESHFEAMRFAVVEDDWIDPRIIVSSDVPYSITPGHEDLSMREHYKKGREAFRTHLDLIKADPSKTPLDHAEALADMGDWSLYFEKFRAARKLYEEAYLVLLASSEYAELADEYLGRPRPMEFTDIIADSIDGAPLEEGSVSLDISMTVTRIGNVRYVQILNPPEILSDDDIGEIRRTVQDTPFRPSLKGGKTVTTEEFIWQHTIQLDSEEESNDEERTS